MAKQSLMGQHGLLSGVADGSIVRDVVAGNLSGFGLKTSREENGVKHHYVIRLGEKPVIEQINAARFCIDFGGELEFEIPDSAQPAIGSSPPAGSLVLISNKLHIMASKGVHGLRLFRIADGAELEGDFIDPAPYYVTWRLIQRIPHVKDVEIRELLKSR